jgi:DNA-binding transcriptional MerR regulator
MAELAQQSGVPAATIKHYIREGLIPGPRLKTGRNMAYYDPALVSRIQAIKELQQTRFLPLRVIRDVLDGADPYRSEETREALESALEAMRPADRRTRRELLEGGMPAEQLDFFVSLGLVTPEEVAGEESFAGDDLALLRTLGAARRAGISPELLPHTIMARYVEAIRELARAELAMFREGVAATGGEGDLGAIVGVAARLSEQLVILLRRKLLLPALRELSADSSAEGEGDEEDMAGDGDRRVDARRL